jgi:hypothetical protein
VIGRGGPTASLAQPDTETDYVRFEGHALRRQANEAYDSARMAAATGERFVYRLEAGPRELFINARLANEPRRRRPAI